METSKKKLRHFYEDLYSKEQIVNPALAIYDRIRVNKIINELKNNCVSGNVLIIGCGSKNDVEIIDQLDSSFAFDLSYNAIKNIKTSDRKLFVADAANLPMPTDIFDMVVMSEVIEHIPDSSIVVREIFRVQKSLGKLILSTPNWKSFFGLYRWLGEFLFGKTITSDDQPYDDWKTIKRIKNELIPYFSLSHSSGIWYLPPLHYKNKGLSRRMTNLLFKIFFPIEIFLSKNFPHLGHLIFLVFISNK